MDTQNAIQVAAAVKPNAAATANVSAPLMMDATSSLLTGKGNKSSLNNSATAGKVVSTAARRICKVIVNTAASAAGGIYDSATTGGIAAGTLVFAIPQTAGIYDVDFPLTAGLSLVVGTAGVVSLSYQ